jgi:hypothetical protein
MSLIDQVRRLPRMVSWFNPILLIKLLLNVVIADIFGQYADRRLIQAALDDETPKQRRERASLVDELVPDSEGAVWFDFVADSGDGFDSTYAIAYLLAQPLLRIDGMKDPLPRGSALFMGGDEVYPTSKRQDYTDKFRTPYGWAMPNVLGDKHPPIFMIPGNHDWYDGLTNFLAMFCRNKQTSIGNWRTRQRRSYFAAELKDGWWLWGIDIALTEDMDQPQADYFVEIAQAMPDNARIILCSAAPGWYEAESKKSGTFRTLDYAAGIARDAKSTDFQRSKNFKIVTILSGDTHHYCRYESDFGTQFITSGGGGAFLHGTHQLPEKIEMDWVTSRQKSVLKLATIQAQNGQTTEACYPSRSRSRSLLLRNILFAFLNPAFSSMLGMLYGVLGLYWMSAPTPGSSIITILLFYTGFASYSYYMNQKPRALVTSAIHAFAHTLALSLILNLIIPFFEPLIGQFESSWTWWTIVLIWSVPLGGFVAGTLFGVGMLINCWQFDMDHNDAYGAMRLALHRHFLRLKISNNQLTVYSIGIDTTPSRDQWSENSEPNEKRASRIIPTVPLGPKLIDEVIVIDADKVLSVLEVSKRRSATLASSESAPKQSTA